MSASRAAVLQVGFGGFGAVHLEAWRRLRADLWVADPDPGARERAATHLPVGRVVADCHEALRAVDVVDIVTPTAQHVDLCVAAIEAGKDVFVEKPLTFQVDEARRLAGVVARSGRVLQVGYYFRHHPLARYARERVTQGHLGRLRYLSGNLYGFKRARGDIGVAANLGRGRTHQPSEEIEEMHRIVFAVQRDHFDRGHEDLALILLTWPDGTLAKLETSYIQPGRQPDTVMPNALTCKTMEVCGSEGALAIDFQAEEVTWHRVRHERCADGSWHPQFGEAMVSKPEPRGAVAIVASQLTEFLGHVAHRTAPEADVQHCGVEMAQLLQAIAASARSNRPVAIGTT